MDFSGKGFELAVLIPYFVLIPELIGLDQLFLTFLCTAVAILIVKIAYQKLIRSAREEQQPKRYALFLMLPVFLFFGSVYL